MNNQYSTFLKELEIMTSEQPININIKTTMKLRLMTHNLNIIHAIIR